MKIETGTIITEIEKVLAEQNIELSNEFVEDKKDLTTINLTNILALIYDSEQKINVEFIGSLINNGVNINSKADNGLSAFLLAVCFGDYELTKMFIDNGSKVDEEIIYTAPAFGLNSMGKIEATYEKITITPLMIASPGDNSSNLKLLINNGANVNDKRYLIDSIFEGRLSSMVSAGDNLLSQAIYNNDIEMVEFLLKKDINLETINCSFDNLIHTRSHFKVLKLLIDAGMDINIKSSDSGTLLEICARNMYLLDDNKTNISIAIADYLLQNGADINIGSPLMQALNISGNGFERFSIAEDMAIFLIENGADVNYVKNGQSILMDACGPYGLPVAKCEIVKLLLKKGADVNYADNDGKTVLMKLYDDIAETYEPKGYNDTFPSERIMNLLLDNGADINARNKMGMTALMQYSYRGDSRLVKILLDNGADLNIKSEQTALNLGSDEIKKMILETKNNNPQDLVKILSNFTIDRPIKYTTHLWDFGELKNEYGSFEGYKSAVEKQFKRIQFDLKAISPSLHKKIYTFLLETDPDSTYSWCSKTDINVGWSSLDGLKEHCDSGKNAFDFKLKEYIVIKKGINRETITSFGEVINLFKQEIEIRMDFKSLESIFTRVQGELPDDFNFDITNSKLQRQFYTDTRNFTNAIEKIFIEIQKRDSHPNIELTTRELDDRSLEIKIIQEGSISNKTSQDLFNEAENGDFADIKEYLKNLCDWSVESICEDGAYRVNYLHSNNVKEAVRLKEEPKGFTHILRFYR